MKEKSTITNNSNCDCKCIHEDKTNNAIRVLNEFKTLDNVSNFYKNFADPTRFKILMILDKIESMCVCDIAVSLDMTKSAISHQLKYLKNCNLIKSNKVGKTVFYSLADNHVKSILEMGIEHIKEGDL